MYVCMIRIKEWLRILFRICRENCRAAYLYYLVCTLSYVLRMIVLGSYAVSIIHTRQPALFSAIGNIYSVVM